MKVAITGAAGLFGHGLVAAFSSRHTVFPLTRADADITDAESVRAALERIRPEVVVHPAGIPDLDIADADPARAYSVNVDGTRHVVESAHAVRARSSTFLPMPSSMERTRGLMSSLTGPRRSLFTGGPNWVEKQSSKPSRSIGSSGFQYCLDRGRRISSRKVCARSQRANSTSWRVTRKVARPTRSMPLTKSWRSSRLAATASTTLRIRERALATNSPGAPPNWPDWTRAR